MTEDSAPVPGAQAPPETEHPEPERPLLEHTAAGGDEGAEDGPRVAAVLSGYDVGAILGQGAAGVVFDGRHRDLGRQVAIKKLHRPFGDDAAVRARFVSEARVLASLDHPHIVAVYDFVQKDGLCLLVMEKLAGGTVWQRFTRSGLTFDDACAITLATCTALQFAHEHNVLHRDIKPDNILFAATGVLKVTDFGIAKVVGGGQTLATRAGDVLGTPAYMAPEQALADEPSAATDVYATGVMLYELLSGRLPFSSEGGPLAVIYRHVHEQPMALGEAAPTVPAAIAGVVMKAIATDRGDRFTSAEDFRSALAAATADVWGAEWTTRTQIPVVAPAPLTAMQAPGGVAVTTPPNTGEGTHVGAGRGPGAHLVPTLPVRPEDGSRARETWAGGQVELDLVPVRELIAAPPLSPVGLVFAAMGIVLLMAALALIGLGSPRPGGTILPGSVTVNGFDVAQPGTPRLDLASPVVVAGQMPQGLKQVRLGFYVLGTQLGSDMVAATQQEDGSFTAPLDLSGTRFFMGGQTKARLEMTFEGEGAPGFTLERTFSATSKQPALISIPGAVGIALLLFVIGYAESFLRCLRHGTRVVLATVGLVAIGMLAGALAVDLAWAGGATQPTAATLVACVFLGIAASVTASRAALQIHRRRQARRLLGR